MIQIPNGTSGGTLLLLRFLTVSAISIRSHGRAAAYRIGDVHEHLQISICFAAPGRYAIFTQIIGGTSGGRGLGGWVGPLRHLKCIPD